jgi:hypothetical protein
MTLSTITALHQKVGYWVGKFAPLKATIGHFFQLSTTAKAKQSSL